MAIATLLFFILFLAKGKGSTKSAALDEASAASQHTPPEQQKPIASALKESTPDAALQLLSLLQQEARFIDFVQEDLTSASDADIGAVARVIHEGSKKTINDYFSLQPLRSEEEETRITLESGFNASEIRLTGNVVGEAPFTGTLVHRGWKASSTKLPKLAPGHDTSIIAPAEVEL